MRVSLVQFSDLSKHQHQNLNVLQGKERMRENAAFVALNLMLSRSAVAAVRPNTVDKAARRSTGRSTKRLVPKAQHTQTLNSKVLPFHQLSHPSKC